VEVATFGKILGHFSPIVPPSTAGFASVASDAGGLLWCKLEHSKPLVLLKKKKEEEEEKEEKKKGEEEEGEEKEKKKDKKKEKKE
jgi:hypothetical protein